MNFSEFCEWLRTEVEAFAAEATTLYPDLEGAELEVQDWFEQFCDFVALKQEGERK